MTGENIWAEITSALTEMPIEVATIPSNKKEPLWFAAYIDGSEVYVYNANVQKPSTNMSLRRKISKKDFLTVYAYYHRWANGERHLRQEVSLLSRNTAYIFGLIAKFE